MVYSGMLFHFWTSSTALQVRVSSKIAEHDLERQLKLARGFVEKGYKVKLLVVFQRKTAREGKSLVLLPLLLHVCMQIAPST